MSIEVHPDNIAADSADEPEPAAETRIDVTLDVDADAPPRLDWLRDRIIEVTRQLDLIDPALSVVIVDDEAIAEMHARFLDVEGTTDVITFDLSGGSGDGVDGELYLCLDEARRQAERLGHDVDSELLLYAVHGLLHLIGYDDHDPAAHRDMHAKEDELLIAIGVGPVYARREGGR